MADPEVATKAPESDAMEDNEKKESLIPGDTPVEQGSSSLGVGCFCLIYSMVTDLTQEHCVTDRPTRQSSPKPPSTCGHLKNAELATRSSSSIC